MYDIDLTIFAGLASLNIKRHTYFLNLYLLLFVLTEMNNRLRVLRCLVGIIMFISFQKQYVVVGKLKTTSNMFTNPALLKIMVELNDSSTSNKTKTAIHFTLDVSTAENELYEIKDTQIIILVPNNHLMSISKNINYHLPIIYNKIETTIINITSDGFTKENKLDETNHEVLNNQMTTTMPINHLKNISTTIPNYPRKISSTRIPITPHITSTKPTVPTTVVTKPPATESSATKPSATESSATKPPATESSATKPLATESSATKPLAIKPPTKLPSTKPSTTKPPIMKPSSKKPPPPPIYSNESFEEEVSYESYYNPSSIDSNESYGSNPKRKYSYESGPYY